MDKIANDARIYNDVQGLEQLRGQYKTNPNAVKKEMAQQFESLLMQMVLHSMREANNVFSSNLFSGNEMALYQDMFDKQLTLALSSRGVGFAKIIEESIDRQMPTQTPPAEAADNTATMIHQPSYTSKMVAMDLPAVTKTKPDEEKISEEDVPLSTAKTTPFKSARDFMKSIWSGAKQAASMIGVHPSVLLAQAALETDWGKKIIQHASGNSSHNLFNIKADPSWQKSMTTTSTLEQKGDVLVKEKANFRSYSSFNESFMDYVDLVKNNTRYKKAVENAQDPEAYSQALQEAGYASDQNYANKIMGIIKSPHFQSLLAELK